MTEEKNLNYNNFLELNKTISYQQIAERYGFTRSKVAGIIFRLKNPSYGKEWVKVKRIKEKERFKHHPKRNWPKI